MITSHGTTTWSKNPRSHIAVFKPSCGRPGCRKGCISWWRCRCGDVVGRCNDHDDAEPIAQLRATHRCALRAA